MAHNTRRTLLKSAAAGAAAIGLVGAAGGIGRSNSVAKASIGMITEPVVAYVSNARKGEIVVMVGTREVVRRDAALVARLVAIAKEAGDVVAS